MNYGRLLVLMTSSLLFSLLFSLFFIVFGVVTLLNCSEWRSEWSSEWSSVYRAVFGRKKKQTEHVNAVAACLLNTSSWYFRKLGTAISIIVCPFRHYKSFQLNVFCISCIFYFPYHLHSASFSNAIVLVFVFIVIIVFFLFILVCSVASFCHTVIFYFVDFMYIINGMSECHVPEQFSSILSISFLFDLFPGPGLLKASYLPFS